MHVYSLIFNCFVTSIYMYIYMYIYGLSKISIHVLDVVDEGIYIYFNDSNMITSCHVNT